MAVLEARNIDKPDERRDFPDGHLEAVHLPGGDDLWTDDVRAWLALVGVGEADRRHRGCMIHHVGYVVSGRLQVMHGDGTELEIAAGDAFVIEPGHDAWTVGDEDVRDRRLHDR